ncbi:hypothetical protein LZ198_23995 [Myxococcus sp. K15C18031901]|uniref:hypothetical protein n=1 Tax=Myxococcus dinghuensis TaxID=2906761 RepID=UPI0020A81A8A|nr:hypothetical protein [Myxococcus dinghuensis]MCP3101933.1 hypothetical protein [Myxococcus dinghuensis]
MTKNILKTAMVVAGVASLMTGCSNEQAEVSCFVQDSASWATKYDALSESGTNAAGEACETGIPPAELVGVFKFANPADPSKAQLTLRPAGLASRGARDPGPSTNQTAIGDFAITPDEKSLCHADTFTEATVDAAATPTAAHTTISYQFSNVRVYSAPSAPGTQITGELKYTRDGCTANYIFRGMWPAVGCDPEAPAGSADNCGAGSFVNPDFAVTCEESVGFCVLSEAVPSLK